MRRTLLIVLSVLAAISLTTSAVFAGGTGHLFNVTFSSGSLIADGIYAGYGNQNFEGLLQGYATVLAKCENKSGKQAPGRNPISVTVTATAFFSGDANGHTDIHLETADPSTIPFEPSPTPKEAGCPNGNWKVFVPEDGSEVWTGARVTIWNSDTGALLIDQCYTIDPYLVATEIPCTTPPPSPP